MKRSCYITIFTPTYNRVNLLQNLYGSLRNQKIKNFEWIIVDDDSTDNTDEVINNWITKNKDEFVIRYFKQKHGGKHRAINKGIKVADGKFFFIVDSDDTLTDNATQLVEIWGKSIEGRKDIAAVSGLKISHGNYIGGNPIMKNMNNWVEASNLERKRYNLGGDKAEVYKTEILKKYPFPEFEGENFITEDVCWDAIAADGYKIRWYNEPIYECEYLEDGLTKSGANGISGALKNYKGYCFYIAQCLNVKKVWEWSGNIRQYNKVTKKMRLKWNQCAKDLKIPLGRYIYIRLIVIPSVYLIKTLYKIYCLICSLKNGSNKWKMS